MERDFMGLSSKQPLNMVKEEVDDDGFNGIGFATGSAVHWTFSDKVSTLPNFMPYGANQADSLKKIRSTDPTSLNHNMAESQIMAGSSSNPKLLRGTPFATAYPVLPTMGCFRGVNDPRNDTTSSGSPAQLTIFYAGMVNVFNDISPEKAQAIMLMAQNMSSMASKPMVQVQEPCLKPVVGEGVNPNALSSGIPSPISVSSHPVPQPGNGPDNMADPVAENMTGFKTSSAMGSIYAANMIPSIPQARKASLARFLEKRKERLMNAAPYGMATKPMESETGESCA